LKKVLSYICKSPTWCPCYPVGFDLQIHSFKTDQKKKSR